MLAELAADQVRKGIVRPYAAENADDEHSAPQARNCLAHDDKAGKQQTRIGRAEERHADISHASTHPEYVPDQKGYEQSARHYEGAGKTKLPYAQRIRNGRHDTEKLIGKLRVASQHVEELPRRDAGKSTEQKHRAQFARKHTEHRNGHVDEACAKSNLQIARVLKPIGRFSVHELFGGVFFLRHFRLGGFVGFFRSLGILLLRHVIAPPRNGNRETGSQAGHARNRIG